MLMHIKSVGYIQLIFLFELEFTKI